MIDLSPLAGLPIQLLRCGGNPITSLQPLHGMEIDDLSIEGIPLDTDNARLLRGFPLRHLECDFTPPALAQLRTHAALQGMNSHTVSYLSTIGETLCQVNAFRQQAPHTGGARGNPLLRQYAVHHAHLSYLTVPLLLSRPEAESFSRYCDGLLACPATPEQFHALLEYLATVIYPGSEPRYHLGLTVDPATGALRWLSGAPYQWHKWHPAAEADLRQPGRCATPRASRTGIPYFMSPLAMDSMFWLWNPDPHARCYFVIEWNS